ncbi:MAG TPA: CBS domain-containing protein [Candidatus Deferrimicrobiaceae bacterium]|nr:CBS domain-containing protein [Candidatus Deferrimicrobiaceae bacterium]
MAMSATAKDFFAREYNTVKENDTLSRCLEGFKKGMPPVLAVTDERGKYAGIITRRSILRTRLDPTKTKVKSLMKTAPEVNPTDSLSRVAKLIITSGIRQLPVFEKGKLIGFITDEAVIHAAVIAGEWGNNPIETIMTRAPYTMEATRSVGAVLSSMREHGVSHVPILDNGKLAGLISIQDILENLYWPQKRMGNMDVAGELIGSLAVAARGIMVKPVITVTKQTILKDAEQKMHKHDISCLCIVENEHLIGIATKLDFLEPISQLEMPERRLSVQFGVKDIEISPEQQQYMMAEFDSFAHRFQDAFQLGSLFIYIKSHRGTNMRGTPMIHCRLQFRTTKGSFFASSEGWGVEPTFKVALDRLDRRLLRSKELLAYNPRFAKDYLREMGLSPE